MSESNIAGVVRDGVVIPEESLPEGARVTISVERNGAVDNGSQPPTEERWRRKAPEQLLRRVREFESRSTSPPEQPAADLLADVLAHYEATETWHKLKKEIEARFPLPRRVGLWVDVVEDMYEPGRLQIISSLLLPSTASAEDLQGAHRQLVDLAVKTIPTDLALLFTCLAEPAPEQP